LKRNDARYRSENLFLRDAHISGYVGENRRLDKIAFAEIAFRQTIAAAG
jgi:hypothetical protein